jgi:MFS family permease
MPFRLTPLLSLSIAGLFAIFSSTISKSPALPLFTAHLGASPAGVGLIAGISAFAGIVASIPAGILSDRFGRKRMMVFSGIIFSTAPFLYLFVNTLWQLALVRFYHGFATAIFIPVGMALVADLFRQDRGEKMGLFSTATLGGRFIAPLLGGSLLGFFAHDPTQGFRSVYLLCGVAGVIPLVFVHHLPDRTGPFRAPGEKREIIAPLKEVLADKNILLTCAVEASILFAYGTFETFLPLYARGIGLTAYEIGIFLSAQVITLALTKPLMGRFSDRHGRMPQIIAGALAGAICIGSFFIFESFMAFLILSISFGLCLSIVTSATSAFIADLSRTDTRGSAMGTLGSIMDIGHTAGPVISGMLALHFGMGYAFIGASIVLVGVALLFMTGVRTPRTVKR